MVSSVARAVRLATLVLAATLLSVPTARAQHPANWTDTISPFRVIDNVYYVGSAGLSAWLITTPQGHILLDVGMPENGTMVERNIVRLGFKPGDVKVLLNSHAHFDHAGGLAQLKRRTGARLFAMAGDRTALEQGVYVGSESVAAYRFPAVRVDSVITDGATVTLGGVTLTANLTPGHSAGCTTWTMPVQSDGRRHTAAFFCSASVAANRLAPRPQYPGIVADYRRTFARLKAMEADVFLPPHAELFDLAARRARLGGGGPNPFIDPTALRRLAVTLEAAFEKELARQSSTPR
ncbi:MAG: subclass B3 metallo-beta-lactamase [Gemmatimonadota bacterium]